MLLKPEIEDGVDAVRCSALQVRKSLEEAKAMKDASMQINEQDEWVRYKTAKSFWQKAEQVEQEAREAYDEMGNCWRTLPVATSVRADPQVAFAGRTAEAAYKQATDDANNILRLVGEVKQNCRDACKGIF